MSVRDYLKNLLARLVQNKFGVLVEFSVGVSESPEHGDYSTNIALVLAQSLQKNSAEVAEEFTQVLLEQLSGWKVETAGPGFINFWISEGFLQKEFKNLIQKGESYGRGKNKKTKLQVEYVSANPTGPLTLANGRGGFLGDVLSNILEFSGYQVEREYYVNDTGNQVITLGKSILASAGFLPEEENFYKGEYVKRWARSNRQKVKKLKDSPLKLGQEAALDFLNNIKKILKKAGVGFDRFTSEDKQLHQKGFVKKALAVLQKSGNVYQKDGAVWLKTTDFGDDKDRVLITSDGFPTYFLADVGHYLETKLRKFDGKINILGPDHFGYAKRIQAAVSLLGFKNSQIIVTQAVRLEKGGKEVKMSKRGGEFVAFEDLLKEIGLDAARYFFLEKSSDTHIDFNLDLAKEKSAENPVYYIQYAHARISSIFRKIKNQNSPPRQIQGLRPLNVNILAFNSKIKITNKNLKFDLLNSEEESALIKKLIQFPEIIEDTISDYQVHRLPRFSLELARSFHNFYEKHRVITDDPQLTEARLNLVLGTKTMLKNLLGLMGMAAPEKM